MIAYIGGILTVALLPSLTYAALLALLLLLLRFKRLRQSLLFYLLGVAVAAIWGAWQLHHRLPSSPQAQDLQISGLVDSLVQHDDQRQVFELAVLTVESDLPTHQRLRRIRLSVYHTDIRFGFGDEIKAVIRLRAPRGLHNPEARDTERYYLASGLDARGYIRTLVKHKPAESFGVGVVRMRVKNWLHEQFEPQAANTLSALIIGDRTGLDDQHWEWLRRTGTAHLLVVSGLHIAVMATLGWLFGRLIAVPLQLCGWMGCSRWLPTAAALLLATLYAALAGWGLPVQRAWLMLVVFLLGNWQLLSLSGWQRLKLSLLVIVSVQPLAILEPGLWLSFGAVALILWQLQQRRQQPLSCVWLRLPGEWWRLQLTLFAGMSLVMVMNFNQLSPAGIVMNLIAVPWISATIWALPVLLLLVLQWPDAATLLNWNLEMIWGLLQWAAQIPGLLLQVGRPSLTLLVLAILGSAIILLPLPFRIRAIALLPCLPLLALPVSQPSRGHFNAWVFDVGQGQAILIETAEGRLLYDTGPGFGNGRSAFAYTVEPYLRSQARPELEWVVVSHADADHSGGFAALRQGYAIGTLLGGEELPNVQVQECRSGSWQIGDISFTLLDPFGDYADLSSNDRSCVLRVSNGRCSLLLTGDLSQSGEYRLLSSGQVEPVTWLVAGHHGSRDSTAGALLDYAMPEHVVISAGYGNRFGHPHADVIERIENREIPWSSTARQGALLLKADNDSCSVISHRELKKRYWTAG